MNRQLDFSIDREVIEVKNPIHNLELIGKKEFQRTTRLTNSYTRVIEKAREQIHSELEGIILNEEGQLKFYIDKLIELGEYVLDIETTGLDPLNDIIVGICLYGEGLQPAYLPILHTDLENNLLPNQLPERVAREEIRRLFDSKAKWINHNIKFDAKFIEYSWGISTKDSIYWDTLISAFILNENEPTHALKALYARYITKTKDKQSYSDLFEKTPFNYIPLDLAKVYGANDGIKTFELYKFHKSFLNPEHTKTDFRKLYGVFMDIEMPLLKVLVDMELTGVEIREDFARELKDKYQEMVKEKEQVIYDIIDRYSVQIRNHEKLQDLLAKQAKNKKFKGTEYETKINLNSAPQKKILFFDILKLPSLLRKDPMSCGKDHITMWLDSDKISNIQRQFLSEYQEWSKLNKLITSFIEKIPLAKDLNTNSVHTNFNQIGTVTGRFSSSHPIHKINLQQIPSRDKYIRKIFKAREGKVFVGSDFSQIEPRILASLSQDEKMIKAYTEGTDLYAMMASEIFKKPYEECLEFHPITGEKQPEGKDRRTQVKSVLLGIMYGRSPVSIANQFGESKEWGERIVADFYKSFAEIQTCMLRTQYQARLLGYTTTITGRKRRLPDMKLPKEDYRYISATRQCLNSVIQGSSADVMKVAIIEIANNKRMQEMGAKLLMTIHDEVILEVNKEYALETADLLEEIMKSVGERMVHLCMKCDTEISEIWTGEDIKEELKCLKKTLD